MPTTTSSTSTAPGWAGWTTAGVAALPLYGVLLALGTLTPQPDQVVDPEGWARFVSAPSYLVSHIVTNLAGGALAVLGTFALAVLVVGRSPRLALSGMVLAEVGQVLFLVPATVSTLVTPAIGRAYLQGNRDALALELPAATGLVTVVALLLAVAGNIVLGVAAARSGVVPRWSGTAWVVGTVVFYLLGFALGVATTGASLPTQPVGGVILALGGAAMTWAAAHRRSGGSVATSRQQSPTATGART